MRTKGVRFKLRRGSRAGLFATILAVACLVAVPTAQAATYTYASARPTTEGVNVYSGVRSSITGGSAFVNLGLAVVRLENYYPAPGYMLIHSATSTPGGSISFQHQRQYNASSLCRWTVGGHGGDPAELTCRITY